MKYEQVVRKSVTEPNKMPLKESGSDTACTKVTKWEHAAIQ